GFQVGQKYITTPEYFRFFGQMRGARKRVSVPVCLVYLILAVTLTACSGGGGDGGGDSGPDTPAQQAGLIFSYPVDGQENVFVQSQIVLSFESGGSALADSLTLVADGVPVNTAVIQDENQPNIFHLQVAAEDESVERPA